MDMEADSKRMSDRGNAVPQAVLLLGSRSAAVQLLGPIVAARTTTVGVLDTEADMEEALQFRPGSKATVGTEVACHLGNNSNSRQRLVGMAMAMASNNSSSLRGLRLHLRHHRAMMCHLLRRAIFLPLHLLLSLLLLALGDLK